jgi:hypothetical protein
MNSIKYVGLDVHQSTISVAVLDAGGKLVMQSDADYFRVIVRAERSGSRVSILGGLG